MRSKWLPRAAGFLLLCLAVSGTASAQYGGGGSGSSGSSGSGTSGSGGYGSGNGKAIGIGVGAAAAAVVGVALYVHHRHNTARSQASHMIGCTQSELSGISLKNENDEQIYMIISSGTRLQVGQRVELTGVVTDQGPGARTFRVQGPIRSYGACSATEAALTQAATAQTH